MKTVYIVDDDAAVRASLGFFLTTSGFVNVPFDDPHEFVRSLGQLEPGCVLLDLRMPALDGFAVLARLASLREQLPVVMMTGHGDVVTAVRAMKSGASDFIEKPFEEEMLLEILGRVFATLDGSLREVSRKRAASVRLSALSAREQEVLLGLLTGHSNKVLAFQLGISIRTIEMHRAGMMDRLGVRTLAEALRLAFEGDLGALATGTPAQHAEPIH